mmetsp:Transcript_78029/g.216749  ORF Transcript_78029/g.216749 Transcript_78029/m.216749 type:complete len:119 (+) Transcript_78029:68-424(+)
MATSDEIAEMKENMAPLLACFCVEQSCTCSQMCAPVCFASGKYMCCSGSAGMACPPCTCECEPCCSEERGCTEMQGKVCCLYAETQCPPSMDIGVGCCGIRCCGGPGDEAEEGSASGE